MPEVPLPKLFTLLFMMMGPLRAVPLFAAYTPKRDAPTRNTLAFRGVIFAGIGVVLAVFMGAGLMRSWGASREALVTVIGLLLLLTALQGVIGWPPAASPEPPPEGDNLPLSKLALAPLAFPNILPPFAVGILVLFASFFPDFENQLKMVGLAFGLLAADYLAMRYARQILNAIGIHTLQVLGAVFGVVQLALAVEMIFWGVKTAFATP
jgi:multiple antibiotic resistance protein